jgi:hypothetical protein
MFLTLMLMITSLPVREGETRCVPFSSMLEHVVKQIPHDEKQVTTLRTLVGSDHTPHCAPVRSASEVEAEYKDSLRDASERLREISQRRRLSNDASYIAFIKPVLIKLMSRVVISLFAELTSPYVMKETGVSFDAYIDLLADVDDILYDLLQLPAGHPGLLAAPSSVVW